MALKFLNNRVSFIGVGVPGFSTAGNQVLRVDGGVGVDTTALRAQVDVPEISIRGNIYDSVEDTGGIGYFLTQDVNGVRWTEVSPFTRNSIFIFNDGVQVGLSSFTGINFQTPGNDGVLFAIEDPLNPNVAQLQYDVRFQKIRRPNENNTGEVIGLVTGFGPDGSFWSLPGYGTSDVVGLTSIGIGTNDPRADLQVGIGSTGVEIYAPDGRVKCEILQARRADIDDNLNVRSLNVSPGVTTVTDININGIGTAFSDFRFQGITSTTDLIVGPGTDGRRGELNVAGVASIGLGTIFSEEEIPALFVSGVTTFSGLTTTLYDLYVGRDLYVAGEEFREQLNAIFLRVTGIATINRLESNVGIITFLGQPDDVGIATLGTLNFTTGFGTALTNEQLAVTGFATIGDLRVDRSFIVGVATIGLADIDAAVVGVATITETTSEQLSVTGVSTLGFTTINPEDSDFANALYVVGVSTFTGISSFYSDVAIDGVLSVPTIDVDNLDTEFLTVSGIATINELQFTTGIGSTDGSLSVNDLNFNVGIGTSLFADELSFNTGVGTELTVENVAIGTGTADELDIDELRFNVGIGTSLFVERIDGTQLSIGVGTTGAPTRYTGVTTLGFATVGLGTTSTEEVIPALFVSGVSTFSGLVTTTYDLFVGRNLSVAGRTELGQLDLQNLNVSGIATINNLEFNVGVGTTARFESAFVDQLDVNNGIATNFTVREDLETEDLQVNDLADIERLIVNTTAQIDDLFANTGEIIAFRATDADIDVARINSGILTNTQTEDLQVTDRASILNADITSLAVSGVGTVNDLRFPLATGDRLNLNVGVITESTTDLARINVGIATTLTADRLNFNVGVGTTLNVDRLEFNAGFGTDLNVAGFTTLGIGTTQASLFVTGISTFSGGGSGAGPNGIGTVVFIEGDLYVDGDVDVVGTLEVGDVEIENLTVGIITITERFDGTQSGINSFSYLDIIDGLNVAGVTTLGLSTFQPTGDAFIFGNVNIVGLATTSKGPTAGVAVTLAANEGITTTGGDLYVGGDLFIQDDLNFDEFIARKGTITERLDVETLYFNVGFGTTLTVGIDTLTGERDGLLSVGFATVGVGTTNEALFVTGISTFSGFTTFIGDVFIDGSLTVNDELVFNQLEVDDLIVNNTANISIATIGIASVSALTAEINSFGKVAIGTGLFNGVGISSTDEAIFAAGISTFVGVGSFIGTDGPVSGFVFIDGNLEVTGDFKIPTLNVDQAVIGILTAGTIGVNTLTYNVGVGTTAEIDNLFFNVGIGTTLTVEDLTYNVGVGTSLQVERLGVSSSLNVSGDPVGVAVTLAGNGGITTTGGDLVVGNDLFIENKLNFGIGIGSTLRVDNLFFNSGLGTTLNLGDLTYNSGIGTDAEIEFARVAIGTIGTADLGTVAISTALNVNAISTFTENVFINGADLVVEDNISVGSSITFNVGVGTTLTVEDLNSTETDTTNLNVTGVATITNLESTNVIVSGVTTTRQLDLSSADTPEGPAVTHFAVEAQSNSQGVVVLAALDNTEYSGFEFTVQAREGASLFQITKLVGVSEDGPNANIFFAEYANVFNTRPLGSFNVISATDDTQLVVNATTANQVDYVVNIVAYKRS